MQTKRTLTQLLDLDKKVWLYFRNEELWKVFSKQAEAEGFTWSDGRKLKRVKFADIIAVNNDMTFNYVGLVGHIWFGNTNDDTRYKIDFARYINGCESYFIKDKKELK